MPSGSKSAGGKILSAIAIAVLTFYTAGALTSSAALASTFGGNAATYATAAKVVSYVGYSIAINLGMAGITQLLAPGPESDGDKNDSYLFSGPSNNGKQGLPVPILYGELIVGGMPISSFYSNSPFRSSFRNFEALGGTPGTEGQVYTDVNGNNLVWLDAIKDFINLSDIDAIYS